MRLEWERIRGGLKPEYALRKYSLEAAPRGLIHHNPIIGLVKLTSPKKKRWHVMSVPKAQAPWTDPGYETLCHLTGVTEQEALNAAKMLIRGAME